MKKSGLRKIVVNGKQYLWNTNRSNGDGDGGIGIRIWSCGCKVPIVDEFLSIGRPKSITPKFIENKINELERPL